MKAWPLDASVALAQVPREIAGIPTPTLETMHELACSRSHRACAYAYLALLPVHMQLSGDIQAIMVC